MALAIVVLPIPIYPTSLVVEHRLIVGCQATESYLALKIQSPLDY